MVAQNYAEMRRGLAKKIGLGRKPGTKVVAKASAKLPAKPVAKSAAAPKASRRAKAAAGNEPAQA
jgi:hypothetical protein